jgi:uncharacterized protein with HEPN domain
MLRDDLTRLRHMLDAARRAVRIASRHLRGDLETDEEFELALTKAVEVVGEAASRVSDDCRVRNPEVPWLDVVAMRHRLVHGYFDVNLDTLWNTVTGDLPPLIGQLEIAIKREEAR